MERDQTRYQNHNDTQESSSCVIYDTLVVKAIGTIMYDLEIKTSKNNTNFIFITLHIVAPERNVNQKCIVKIFDNNEENIPLQEIKNHFHAGEKIEVIGTPTVRCYPGNKNKTCWTLDIKPFQITKLATSNPKIDNTKGLLIMY